MERIIYVWQLCFNDGYVPHDDDVYEYAAGSKDALIQIAVVAEGLVEMTLCGKCYYQGVRL